MKKFVKLFALFLMAVFHTSCGGQNKTDLSKENITSEPKDIGTSYGPNPGVFGIKQDGKGNIWMATIDGVYRYDGRLFSNITAKVSSDRFSSVLEDRKGKFWFASLGSGVFYYDGKSFRNFKMSKSEARPDSVHVSIYQQRLPENSGLHNDVHAIIQDKTGRLWFGTRGHTFIFDGKTFTTLTNRDGKAGHGLAMWWYFFFSSRQPMLNKDTSVHCLLYSSIELVRWNKRLLVYC
jgi:ligand-binding sensor domain-containing protein